MNAPDDTSGRSASAPSAPRDTAGARPDEPPSSRGGPDARGQSDDSADDSADVTVHVAGGDAVAPKAAWIRERLIEAARRMRSPQGHAVALARVHVEIVGDASMDAYHRRHSGVEGTTDVLTFLASDPDEPIDVDIIACVDVARRQAAERGHPVERELLLYAVHGLLHCAGHDDHDPEAYRRMHEEEDRVLTAIGVGATFRSDGAEGGS